LGELEKLALIADSLQTMFRGKTSVVLELNKEEYNKIITHFREVDRHHKQFTIDMSGTDFIFVLNEDML
jgi:uncharacterized protein YlzI (FlbEa/FlbD family)